MNRYIILLLVSSIHSMAAGSESWVRGLGHKEGDVYVSGVVSDSHHNAIIAGSFNAAQLELSETITLQNNGISDIFLVKYNSRGEIIWATSFGGIYEDQASDIFVDRENNLYITGTFRSPAFTVGSKEIGSMWPENVYVAKFDQNGSLQWLKHSTLATQEAISKGVYCDENMNVYFTGYTRSKQISFGDIHLQLNTTNNKGFFCRLDQEGNFEMAGLLGGYGG